jgi:DNA invertase Pin-like site-specific DNA recombinase
MTIWAYYRVSTDDQTVESQKVGVMEYIKRLGLTIDKEIIDDGVSGTVLAKDRNLNKILKKSEKGDKVIVSELSRLGRSTSDVLNTCQIFIKKGVDCYFCKQAMALDNTPMGKMMVAILSAFAEMERDLISQRTKEGLARVKASGKTLGRPIGARNIKLKTDDIADEIIAMYNDGKQATKICKKFNISPPTFYRFLEKKGIYTPKVIKPLLVDGMYFKDFCKDKGINPTSLIQWCQRGFDSIEDYADHLIKAKEKKQKKSQEIIEEVKQDRARITRTKNSIRLSW